MDTKAIYRQRNREYILSHKDVPCLDCGGKFPRCCMDFHHVDEDKDTTTKRNGNSLTTQMSRWKRERIDLELSKCVVLCANCHRIRHHG